MNEKDVSRSAAKHKGQKAAAITVVVAIFCTIVGVVLATYIDFPSSNGKASTVSLAALNPFPVVERDGELESPFVAVVEKVQDAVVNISAQTVERQLPWWYHGSNYATSSGSGFFFREDGYILTNNHVVENAVSLTVRTASGYEYQAELVGSDPETDLAVLKVEPEEKITVIPFGNSDEIKVGDWAIAIGNPFPQQGLDRTVTVGVISAKGRSNLKFGRETPKYQYYIQTDASINPGNSGGPLLNIKGECIGVNAAITTPSGGSVGIGFAIPINLARAVVPDLIAYGKPHRGWLGVRLANVTEKDAKRLGLDAVKGVKIVEVVENSPASKAGIQPGDVVISFNNQSVENIDQFSVLVSTVDNGVSVPVEVIRNGKKVELTTTIGDLEAYYASLKNKEREDDFQALSWLGMEMINFTPEVAQALSLAPVKGVYVRRVVPGSPADRASIVPGTIILQINKKTTKSIADIEKVAKKWVRNPGRLALIVKEPDGIIARKIIRP